ncbi:MAG: ATPase, partial [Nitrospinae bacterium]|nr:ATPase [Nitrospinota bacterium]
MENFLEKKNNHAQTAVIGDVTLKMSLPDDTKPELIGQTEVLKQILACW